MSEDQQAAGPSLMLQGSDDHCGGVAFLNDVKMSLSVDKSIFALIKCKVVQGGFCRLEAKN
jgi:hypothetical protein